MTVLPPKLPLSVDPVVSTDIALLREGDVDAVLNKKVQELILASTTFIVYLDEDYYVEFRSIPDWHWPEGAGQILNEVASLEVLSSTQITSPYLKPFRRMLAEAVARIFSESSTTSAADILRVARQYLSARAGERARTWYLTAAFAAAFLFVSIAITIWVARDSLGYSTHKHALEVAVFACLGALGALISVLSRSADLPIDAAAGKAAHYLEGVSRILLGVCGGFLVAVAIKANLILGVADAVDNEIRRLAVLASLSVASGASERLVPNLIRRFEALPLGSASQSPKSPPEGSKGSGAA